MKKAANLKKTQNRNATPRRTKERLLAELPALSKFARTRREQLGYTQQEMAFRSGLNARFIKEFELGKRTARLDKVVELLDFLGADLKAELRKP
jgi:predicted transcriptional regulator